MSNRGNRNTKRKRKKGLGAPFVAPRRTTNGGSRAAALRDMDGMGGDDPFAGLNAENEAAGNGERGVDMVKSHHFAEPGNGVTTARVTTGAKVQRTSLVLASACAQCVDWRADNLCEQIRVHTMKKTLARHWLGQHTVLYCACNTAGIALAIS